MSSKSTTIPCVGVKCLLTKTFDATCFLDIYEESLPLVDGELAVGDTQGENGHAGAIGDIFIMAARDWP